ncbi:methyltransferase domain-containing protein [Roseovarius salis]|uniref:class I SAM-dependent methyltransferase n=1 Tax=Roseovarius salis TaxID=3376063 RepID=UPI0037C84246
MKLTIHIGSHKAGSTAIQNTCSRETAMLEEAGVYYPENLFPKFPKQHSELAALAEHGDETEMQATINRIFSEAKDRGLSHVFLSGEDLCSATSPSGINRLAGAVTGTFDKVVIILVLRRKYDYLLSHLNHHFRHHGEAVNIKDFNTFLKFSPRDTVEKWSKAFGDDAVMVFPYDSPADGQSFLRRFFSANLSVPLTEKAIKASASVNASFDLLSAIVVNEAVKTLPEFDLTDLNLAYLDAFRRERGRMPVFEADIATYLNELFPDTDWVIDGFPELTQVPPAAHPLGPDAARNYLQALSDFFSTLRGLYCSDEPDVPLGRGEIVSAYRAFLGRVPSRDELKYLVGARKTMPALRQMIVDSPEFRRVHREKLNAAGLALPALDISVAANETQQHAMFDHLRRHWNRLGAEPRSEVSKPGVDDRQAVTPGREEAHLGTGAEELNDVRQTLARAGHSLAEIQRLVDFGCGLGRFTLNAAKEIPEVVGVDFSANQLEEAEAAARGMNVDNITWVQKQGIEPVDVGTYDAWYSRFMLQYSPPPLIERWLREGLGGVRDSGVAIFQVPTYSLNYHFSVEHYLENLNDGTVFQMHCFPQKRVFEILSELSYTILEVRDDNSVDIPRHWVSSTFVAKRCCKEKPREVFG